MREGRVEHVELVGVREELAVRREVGSISVLAQQNCSGLTPCLEADLARLADERQVFGVVDRQLHGLRDRDGRKVDVFRPSQAGLQREPDERGQCENPSDRYGNGIADITTRSSG